MLNQRRAELDKLIKQYASYQNPFRDTSQPMENPWPGTAPPPQGMHSNVPFQTPKSEYESEYESDDTEIPKSEYDTTNVKNMHLHRDSNPGPWNTVPML